MSFYIYLLNVGNTIYHLILPYLCIYTIAETHLVLYSHPFLVIAQVQWRVSLSMEIFKVLQNLKAYLLTYWKRVRVELTSVPTLVVGLMSPFSLHVHPLRAGNGTRICKSVRYSLC